MGEQKAGSGKIIRVESLIKRGAVSEMDEYAASRHLGLESGVVRLVDPLLKRELAARYPADRETYIEGKTAFVRRVLLSPVICCSDECP